MNLDSNLNNIDIIIPSSDKYMKYTAALIVSILENVNSAYRVFFHIITEDIKDSTKIKIDLLKLKYDFEIEYKYLRKDEFLKLPCSVNNYIDSDLINSRLLLGNIFENLDKVIILDADTIVLEDVSKLWLMDLENNYLGAVRDMWYKTKDYTGLSYKKGEYYVNAGVILADLAKWRLMDIESKFNQVEITPKMGWPDQDLLNVLFKNKILYLDCGWNWGPVVTRLGVNLLDPEEKQEIINTSKKIIHYMCHQKPWTHVDAPYSEYFWYYARLTPFYELLLSKLGQETVEPVPVKDILLYRKNILKYWRCKFLYKINFGKKKEHYRKKKNELKTKIRNAKKYLN